MRSLALFLVCGLAAAGAAACAGSPPAPATPSNTSSRPTGDVGATNAQAAEEPNRALDMAECQEVGAHIGTVCRATNSRQARIDGWCSDMIARTEAADWVGHCAKTLKRVDSMCYRSTDNAQSMMVCDRGADE